MDEGLLYQRIMHVPGLTGTWQQRLAQYYKALTGKAYQGTTNEGLYMLNQIAARNFPQAPGWGQPAPAPAPVAQPVNTAVQAAQQAAQEVPTTPFGQIMAFEEYFPGALAQSSAAQRSARYYNPLVQSGQESLESEYADRGLTRSGARGKSLMKMYRDYADQEALMREQLYGQAESEAREGYAYQNKLYEEAPKAYQKSTADASKYTYQFPEESPQRYAQSYRDWLRASYNM